MCITNVANTHISHSGLGDYHENGSTEPKKALTQTSSGHEKAGIEMSLPFSIEWPSIVFELYM